MTNPTATVIAKIAEALGVGRPMAHNTSISLEYHFAAFIDRQVRYERYGSASDMGKIVEVIERLRAELGLPPAPRRTNCLFRELAEGAAGCLFSTYLV